MKQLLLLLTLLTGLSYSQVISNPTAKLKAIPQDVNGARLSVMAQYDTATGYYSFYNPSKNAGTSNLYARNMTSTTSADSLPFGFLSDNIQLLNDASTTDTLYIAYSSTFGTTSTIKIVGGEAITLPKKWLYIHAKFGYTATASKKYRVIVW